MNRFLAAAVGWINALVAWLLIIVGVLAGIAGAEESQIKPALGAVIGGSIGFIVAFYLCGLLSLFIEIRRELIKIRAMLSQEGPDKKLDEARSLRATVPSIE